jgi:hypothetical protein
MTPMRIFSIAALLCVALLTGAPAQAASARVHATVVSLQSSSLVVSTPSGTTMTVTLAPGVRLLAVRKSSLEDVGPGSYIGTTVVPQPNGTYQSTEVHIFAPSLRGTGEGFTKMDPSGSKMMANSTVREAPEHMMANSTVRSASSSAGAKTISMVFPSGRKTIVIPPSVPVIELDPGTKALLVKGAPVLLIGAENGPPSSIRAILVGRPGTVLPL